MLLFPPLFVAAWFIAAAGVSSASGWSTLATRFRALQTFTGARWTWRSARMRWSMNYNNCLTIGSSPEGLYLAMPFLFSFRHPPLLIPWNEITIAPTKLFLMEMVRFELGFDLKIPLTLRRKLADEIKQAAGDHWLPNQMLTRER